MRKLTQLGGIIVIILSVILGVWGVWNSWIRAATPFKWSDKTGEVIVSELPAGRGEAAVGDVVLRIGEVAIGKRSDINYALDGAQAGDRVTMLVRRDGRELSIQAVLARHATWLVTLVNLTLGLFMIAVGGWVFLNKPDDQSARIFLGLTLTLALSILISTSRLPAGPWPWNMIPPLVYWFIYPLFPAFFLRFATIFPKEKLLLRPARLQTFFIYLPAVVFILWLQIAQIPVLLKSDSSFLELYYQGLNFHRIYIILFFFGALAALLHSLITASARSEKDKVRWILWGIALGCAPFIVLWTLPQAFGLRPLVPEEVTALALLIAPVSVAVAIVRYRILDVDLVINRSLVYAILTGLVVCGYALISGLAGHLLLSMSPETNRTVTILVTAVAAILFHPAKQKIQHFVDRTFYRIKYNYRLVTKDFGQQVVTTRTQQEALELFSEYVREALPLEKLAVLNEQNREFSMLYGFQIYQAEKMQLESKEIAAFLNEALDGAKTQTGGGHLRLEQPLSNYGWALFFPMLTSDDEYGALLLGQKLSGAKYSEEDIELVAMLVAETANAVSRIRFQEAIVQERAEREKLQAINLLQDEKNRELELKNQEILRAQEKLVTQEKLASLGQLTAGIAHEIKNPLNFVNNFAQLSSKFAKKLAQDLEKRQDAFEEKELSGIQSNLERLQQLNEKINEHGKRADGIVRSMMEHARTGKGERQPTDLNDLLDESANLVYHGMRARQTGFNITFEKEYDETLEPISLISQDVSRVFLNIIGNGCYATNKKATAENGSMYEPTIWLKTKKMGEKAEIRIRDNGTGMPEEVSKQIFEPFYTTKPSGEGTGLGLSISYDTIVKGHGGELRVESEEGGFTEFIITLPCEQASE